MLGCGVVWKSFQRTIVAGMSKFDSTDRQINVNGNINGLSVFTENGYRPLSRL